MKATVSSRAKHSGTGAPEPAARPHETNFVRIYLVNLRLLQKPPCKSLGCMQRALKTSWISWILRV